MKRWLAFLLMTAGWATCAWAQGVRYDNVAYGPHGTPFGPATIQVWNGTGAGTAIVAAGTAGATEAGLTVTITTAAAHGFSVNQTVAIAGITNATNGAFYNGIWTIAAVPSSTTFQYTATTSGLAPAGYGIASVTGSLVYQDKLLTDSLANPFTSDGLGNYGFWGAPGLYIVGVYGPQLVTKTIPVDLSCDPTGSGCGGSSGSCLAGAPDTQYVDSQSGVDTNAGTNWCSAKATEAAAVTALGATGGLVLVAPNYTNALATTAPNNVQIYRLNQQDAQVSPAYRILFPNMNPSEIYGSKITNVNAASLAGIWGDAAPGWLSSTVMLNGETGLLKATETSTNLLMSSAMTGAAQATQGQQINGVLGICDALSTNDCTGVFGIATTHSGSTASNLEAALFDIKSNTASDTGWYGVRVENDSAGPAPSISYAYQVEAPFNALAWAYAFHDEQQSATHGAMFNTPFPAGSNGASQDIQFGNAAIGLWSAEFSGGGVGQSLLAYTSGGYPIAGSFDGTEQGRAADVAPGSNHAASIATTNLIFNRTLAVVHYYLYQAAAGSGCSGNATVTLTISWTDPNGTAQSVTSSSVSMGNSLGAGDFAQGTVVISAQSSTWVTYSATYTAGTGCSTAPAYNVVLNAQ